MRPVAVKCAVTVSNFSIPCASSASRKDVRGISRGVLPALQAYDWPGNVREFENIVERSVALATGLVAQLRLAAWGVRPEGSARALPPAAGGGRP
jgi:transcriptional regulator with PAS, ATPase and Fis domain